MPYISSGEEVKGNKMAQEKTNENRIACLIDWLSGNMREKSDIIYQI